MIEYDLDFFGGRRWSPNSTVTKQGQKCENPFENVTNKDPKATVVYYCENSSLKTSMESIFGKCLLVGH